MRNSIIIVILLIIMSCETKHSMTNKIYIGLYGRPKNRIEVRIDDQVLYRKDTTVTKLLEIDRGPITVHKDQAVFFLAVDNKDTLFTYPLKQNNYFNIGYSEIRGEFQFTVYDSINFFNSRMD
jgi:hypothetical protein